MKVEILTTPDCSNCSVVERMLDEMKIQYEVIDVTKKTRIPSEISYLYSTWDCN